MTKIPCSHVNKKILLKWSRVDIEQRATTFMKSSWSAGISYKCRMFSWNSYKLSENFGTTCKKSSYLHEKRLSSLHKPRLLSIFPLSLQGIKKVSSDDVFRSASTKNTSTSAKKPGGKAHLTFSPNHLQNQLTCDVTYEDPDDVFKGTGGACMYNIVQLLIYATQKFVHFGQKKAILNVCGFYFMHGFTWGVAILCRYKWCELYLCDFSFTRINCARINNWLYGNTCTYWASLHN